MRYIVIDIRPLLPKNPPTGVPEYTRELLKAMLPLAARESDVRVILFSSGRKKPDMSAFSAYKKAYWHYHLAVPNKLLNASFKLFKWPRIDSVVRGAYGISPAQPLTVFAPNINLLPLSRRARLVITFHDLSFERYPFFLTRRELWWHRLVNPYKLAWRADKIIAVSQSTKQDLISLYNIPKSAIHVVYSGIGDEFKAKNQELRSKKQGILYLGSADGRKNVSALVKAFNIVKNRVQDKTLELVLAGPPHRIASFEERITLYQQASLFVYPSFFEGFGLPPLEAMKSGMPVITSNTSSLPEATQDAAVMVNPHKIAEIAKAMEFLLTDQTLRDYYIQKGIERAKQFSWERTAQRTLVLLTKPYEYRH